MPGSPTRSKRLAPSGSSSATTVRGAARPRPCARRAVAAGGRAPARAGPMSLDARTGSARPLTASSPSGSNDEPVREAAGRLLADRDRPRRARRLDARGDVRRVAERDGLRAARADRADAGPARVDADPDGEVGDAPGLGDVAGVVAGDLEDPQAPSARRARDRPRAPAGRRSTRRCRPPRRPGPCRRTPRPPGSSASRTRRRAPSPRPAGAARRARSSRRCRRRAR